MKLNIEKLERLLIDWKTKLKVSDVPGNEDHTTWVQGIIRGLELAIDALKEPSN
jgi:hypothetical protein